jgi:hypothetical protein
MYIGYQEICMARIYKGKAFNVEVILDKRSTSFHGNFIAVKDIFEECYLSFHLVCKSEAYTLRASF